MNMNEQNVITPPDNKLMTNDVWYTRLFILLGEDTLQHCDYKYMYVFIL